VRTRQGQIHLFHIKTVPFDANQVRIVEDWYTTPLDSNATYPWGTYERAFHYVMASGGSWRGKIGEATITLEFLIKGLRHPKLKQTDQALKEEASINWNQEKHNTIFWSGFAKPSVHGNVLVFHRKNFKPTEADDIGLIFGPFKDPGGQFQIGLDD
jgi:hypothetical protein